MRFWTLVFNTAFLTITTDVARSQPLEPESSSQIRLRLELGRHLSEDIERRDGRIGDSAIVDYVQGIGNRLVRTGGSKSMEVRITASSEMYAHLLPNGMLYVSAGFLERLENEAELAGLLAHQLAHLREPMTAGPSSATIPLLLPACVLSSKNAQNRRSTEQRGIEFEATKFAVQTLKTAGYEPSAVLDLLSKVAYEHPSWRRAISPDDLLDLRATIENDSTPQVGYLLDSSEFVRQHWKIVTVLGHSLRGTPSSLVSSSQH
jgi:predicted Zn-dependent protease